MHQESQEGREHHQGGRHAGGNASGHDLSQALNALMAGKHQAAESGDGGQT
jgi:predicted heme/steroid binding protein